MPELVHHQVRRERGIDGGSGVDTYDLALISSNTVVDFESGMVRSDESGKDSIYGFENAITGDGADTLIANASVNVLTGGVGNDTFVFNSVVAADGDRIVDFMPGDLVDLSGIASAFNFCSETSFALLDAGSIFSHAGQLIVRTEADATY